MNIGKLPGRKEYIVSKLAEYPVVKLLRFCNLKFVQVHNLFDHCVNAHAEPISGQSLIKRYPMLEAVHEVDVSVGVISSRVRD